VIIRGVEDAEQALDRWDRALGARPCEWLFDVYARELGGERCRLMEAVRSRRSIEIEDQTALDTCRNVLQQQESALIQLFVHFEAKPFSVYAHVDPLAALQRTKVELCDAPFFLHRWKECRRTLQRVEPSKV